MSPTPTKPKTFPPDWLNLSKFGHSKVLRSSYFWLFFVPIAARTLEKIPSQLTIPLFGQVIPLHVGLPFSWQVMFAASICFSIATFIYNWKCPPLIRDYSNLKAFEDEGRSSVQIAWFLRDYGAKLPTGLEQYLSRYEDRLLDEGPFNFAPPAELNQTAGDFFHNARRIMRRESNFWLWFCFVAYCFGFGFVGWIVYQNIQAVIRVTFCTPTA